MSTDLCKRLEDAVVAICPDIEKRVKRRGNNICEKKVWWEISCCVLSSQVNYSIACSAADAIERSGLLLSPSSNYKHVSDELLLILNQPMMVDGRYQRYRFPKLRSKQLGEIRAKITTSSGSLVEHLNQFGEASKARSWFVENAPGLGPKQASMFLRNVGSSYDLAIIDRHVIDYMNVTGLSEKRIGTISGLKQYGHHESRLRQHANRLGYPVGLLDWAVWIVMRAMKQLDSRFAV